VIDDGGPPVPIPHARQVDAQREGLSPAFDDPNGLDRLGRQLANIDQAIVSCLPERRIAWAKALKGSGVEGAIVSEKASEMGAIGVRRYDEAGVYALVVSVGALGMRARVAKRLFDLVVAASALVVLALPLLLAALAIRLDDGGPVLFVQDRVGRGNRLFRMYKFRTMRVEANDPDGARSAEPWDDRVTPVGRFLRRTSLDELPQLFNVLIGNMSLVGPRPHALGSQAGAKPFWLVDHRYWERHSLKPGITGLAQARGLRGATHSESDLNERLQADLEYLAGWSLWRDIAILFSTLKVLVHDRAY
jgi:lipopolysaccharide/colanic/teichoic acid biosynthesis glycosyltransferase